MPSTQTKRTKKPEAKEQVRIRVVRDEYADSPREWSNTGLMACWHRNYNLGDVQPKRDPQAWFEENVPEGSVVLDLWLIDHSGISMRTSSFDDCDPGRWDSGQVGWIVATPEKMREGLGLKPDEPITDGHRAEIRKYLKQEVETYDEFIQGNCWGYVIEKGTTCSEDFIHWEVEDSCYGFIGDDLDGMKGHVDEKLWPLLEKAWEDRR